MGYMVDYWQVLKRSHYDLCRNGKDLYNSGGKKSEHKIILYHLNCNYKFIKYVCMMTKTGGKYTKKNIVLGDGGIWLNFILSFSKMLFNIVSFKIKINRETITSVSTGNEVLLVVESPQPGT